ncbi:MAG: type I-E CRISPR-associated protein Cas5/CasD [Caldilineaceae bacterium]|nr:type I-E CRISPR-associated protein Cas5/CasD [Caldilineaceae bacterium]
MNTLFLRLEAPLQSWGERGQWSVRDSATEPTKSGIVGLLACASGFNKEEQIRNLSAAITIAVRCDREGVPQVDYHTIGGGYDTPQLLTAEGKPKVSNGQPHTEISYRTYLHNASFLVVIQANREMIQQLTLRIQEPVWSIFLGRKSCPPSRPPYEGVGQYDSLDHALEQWPWYNPDADRANQVNVRSVIECINAERGIRRRHALLSRSNRVFGPLYVREQQIAISVIPSFPPVLESYRPL